MQEEEDKDLSGDNSDSDGNWRTGITLLRNPFAAKEKEVVTTTHQGYYTHQGLKRQQQQQTEALKRSTGINPASVLKVLLNKKEVSNYLSNNSNHYGKETVERQQPEQQSQSPLRIPVEQVAEDDATF